MNNEKEGALMKKDIDSILDSMFRDGRMNFRSSGAGKPPKAAKVAQPEPEDYLQESLRRMRQESQELDAAIGRSAQAGKMIQEAEQAQQGLSESLQESIERMTREAQADMEDLRQHLEMDGVKEERADNGGGAFDLEKAFQNAREEALAQVFGQEEFVESLTLAFKRPFVAGSAGDFPLCRAALLGSPGTGRHSGVKALTASLGRQGVLKSPKTASLDLGAYAAPGSEKLFVQDLYAALKGGASALFFENYGQCHPSVLPMAAALFTTGSVPLPGRYAEQKGLLVDVGSALAPGAVSKLSAGGKYLFLLAGPELSRLTGAFGGEFIAALDDVLFTGAFTQESLEQIAQASLGALSQRAEKQLGFLLRFGTEEVKALSAKYTKEQGAAAIEAGAQALYKAMSEEKLRKSLRPPVQAFLKAQEGGLAVEYSTGESVSGRIVPQEPGRAASQAELAEVKAQLEDIVGLQKVKDYILSLEDTFQMQQLRRRRGLKAEPPSMHMIFTGNPGTGKTTVARIAARYLKAMGALSGGQLVEVTRADLVGQYVGHTAPLTQKAIQSAMGGVLFIDEAYALYRGRDDSFGLEAIDALVKGMEDHRDRLVVILAGYSREMEEFLSANSGLRSRFPNLIEFPDYTAEELVEITESIVEGKGYRLDPACRMPLLNYYREKQLTGDSRVNGNGRMARNKVEAAVIACSRRNMRAEEAERDLELLLPEDFEVE
ncbi:MAG: AAA family ATPase [Acutalibacter sp.]|nr:AAA family ATPase [Acutalibacter sp.]